jgi:hypothetical protein
MSQPNKIHTIHDYKQDDSSSHDKLIQQMVDFSKKIDDLQEEQRQTRQEFEANKIDMEIIKINMEKNYKDICEIAKRVTTLETNFLSNEIFCQQLKKNSTTHATQID